MPESATDLDRIFDSLSRTLTRFAPPLSVRQDVPAGKRNVHLWSEREVEIEGRKRSEVYFAGAIVQKGYVGFYFMPVYTHAEQKGLFAPELLGLLRGKSCFHVKRLDPALLSHVDDALKKGLALYRERGWVE
jgi:hypothetical protein